MNDSNKKIKLISPLLLPVIEILPFDYSDNIESPDVARSEDREGWEAYNIKCLETINLKDLIPLEKGESYYEPEKISDSNLTIILNELLKDVNLEEWYDETPPFRGGYILMSSGKSYITPGCCSDLGNVEDYKEVLNLKSTELAYLPNGAHPEAMNSYKYEGNKIIIFANDFEYEVLITDYEKMIKETEEKLDKLYSRLIKLLPIITKIEDLEVINGMATRLIYF